MSESDLKKADGCDVFLSFIIVLILFAGFFIFKFIMEPDAPLEVDYKTDQKRIETVAEHKSLNATYIANINTFVFSYGFYSFLISFVIHFQN